MATTRRFLLGGATAILATGGMPPLAFAQQPGATSKTELDEIIAQEVAQSTVEPITPELTGNVAAYVNANGATGLQVKADRYAVVFKKLDEERQTLGPAWPKSWWAPDSKSVDYTHLAALGAIGAQKDVEFTLTDEVLRGIAAANEYEMPLAAAGQRVIFGLRGCLVTSGSKKFQPSARLKEATPDHVRNRCVIGVWDRDTKQIAVFQASTVPNLAQMDLHWLWAEFRANGTQTKDPGLWATNLLPQGLHSYVVGTHLSSAKEKARRQPGALKQKLACPVLRARTGLAFTVDEFWEYCRAPVFDNIHAGVFTNPTLAYSSQGCQTIPGGYSPKGEKKSGDWADLHTVLGLGEIDPSTQTCASDGTVFRYMLTTGREARLHAELPAQPKVSLYRVRFGSEGPRARATQKFLKDAGKLSGAADGQFGRNSMVALLELQKDSVSAGPRDGVLTAQTAKQLALPAWD